MSCAGRGGKKKYSRKAEFDHRSLTREGSRRDCASVYCLWQGLPAEGLDFKCISITRLGRAQETLKSHRKSPLSCLGHQSLGL